METSRMLCKRCRALGWNGGTPRRPAEPSSLRTCEWCGAALETPEDVLRGVRDGTLAQLARFGLAITSEPLFERISAERHPERT